MANQRRGMSMKLRRKQLHKAVISHGRQKCTDEEGEPERETFKSKSNTRLLEWGAEPLLINSIPASLLMNIPFLEGL